MRMIKIFFCLLFVIGSTAFASTKENQLAVHLLSYLAQDYGEAVANGKVISKGEYEEQIDFSNEVIRIAKENNYNQSLSSSIQNLNQSILAKSKVHEVSALANKIKSEILKQFNLLTYPETKIDLTRAANLYKNNCMSCHGQNGYGDGEAGEGLEPSPTNFHDLERMRNVSPYGAYNTITLGVNETGMAAHDYLSKEDRWSLAYYVSSFRFKNIEKRAGLVLDVKESSSLSDNEIQKKFDLKEDDLMGMMATIRDINSPPPSNGNKGQVEIYLKKAIKDLKASFSLYKAGKLKEARNLSLSAYLQGVEPVEGILKSKNADLVIELETSLAKYRGLISESANHSKVESVLNPILSKLQGAIDTSTIKKTNVSSFLVSFGIVLREAFEAGLILFLLLSLTRKSNATAFNKHIHLGWISSIAIGVGAYILLSRYISITGEVAESLEGYTALIASLLLFYVGYWMHKNTDIQKLKDKFTSAVDTTLGSGRGLTLFFIAFTASFREIFETILFLKVLILDGYQQYFVGIGAISAVLLTFFVILVAIKFSIKLNLKYLFKASTILILSLSTIFLGKGIGALQKTGVFPQTSLDIFSLPSIGFNSTLEVLIAQMIMVLLVLSFFIASRLKLEKGMA
ncbi:MAG: hypothetical protein CME65_10745 [Halobacteriovoraceae bacterium]|nr:hypothetical protein [Halobacteriovoraceae bacterium]MAZ49034.1 hypothetical protein [Halobacteriovoraceae bacterium]